jgi:hypothetical protein
MKHPGGVLKIISISILLLSAALHGNDPLGFLYAMEPLLGFLAWDAYSGAARFIMVLFIGFEGFTAITLIMGKTNKRTIMWNVLLWVLGFALATLSFINLEDSSSLSILYLSLLLLSSVLGIANGVNLWRKCETISNTAHLKQRLGLLLLFAVSTVWPFYTLNTQPWVNPCAWKQGQTIENAFDNTTHLKIRDSEGMNLLPELIKHKEAQLWIIVPHLASSHAELFNRVNSLAVEAEHNGIKVIGIAEGTPSVLEDFRHELQTPFPFYTASASFMRNYTRSNPTVVFITKIGVLYFWPSSSLPQWSALQALK